MILVPKSFLEHELKESNFSVSDVGKALIKTQKGLGKSLGALGLPKVKIHKISFTAKNGHARMAALLQTEEDFCIPILLRSKKDSVGKNMSAKNSLFVQAFLKSYERIQEDIKNDDFEILLYS